MTTKKTENDKLTRELFAVFDKNKDGNITRKELKIGLRCANGTNPTKAEIKEILAEMGVKKGQTIGFDQFSKCIANYIIKSEQKDEEAQLRDSFKLFDRNKNGSIDKQELIKALTSLGDKMTSADVDDMFKAADINKDGNIQYKEFVKLFTKDAITKKNTNTVSKK